MLTNKEFIRMHAGETMSEEKARECLSRFSALLTVTSAAAEKVENGLKSLGDENKEEAAKHIASEVGETAAGLCEEYADVIDCESIAAFLRSQGRPVDTEEFTAGDMLEFVKYIAGQIAGILPAYCKDNAGNGGLCTFEDFCQELEKEVNSITPNSEEIDDFNPVETAALTGAPVLFS